MLFSSTTVLKKFLAYLVTIEVLTQLNLFASAVIFSTIKLGFLVLIVDVLSLVRFSVTVPFFQNLEWYQMY